MAGMVIELPSQAAQAAFNLRRWEELSRDPDLARIEGRIETDRHGQIIMSPPPAPSHGSFQSRIAFVLQQLMDRGRVITECPISTADGVKAADVAWASAECMRELGNRACFPRAPDICVEVLSPANTRAQIAEKRRLYFDAGAREVWTCSQAGEMRFWGRKESSAMRASAVCPQFPRRILLR